MGIIAGLLTTFAPALVPTAIKILMYFGWKEERAKDLFKRVDKALDQTPDSTLPGDAEAAQLKELEEKLHPKPPTT